MRRSSTTNAALAARDYVLYVTESESGTVMMAHMPAPGLPLFRTSNRCDPHHRQPRCGLALFDLTSDAVEDRRDRADLLHAERTAPEADH